LQDLTSSAGEDVVLAMNTFIKRLLAVSDPSQMKVWLLYCTPWLFFTRLFDTIFTPSSNFSSLFVTVFTARFKFQLIPLVSNKFAELLQASGVVLQQIGKIG